MTEDAWLTLGRPRRLIDHLIRRGATSRKLQLISSAICRLEELDVGAGPLIDLVERYAEGLVDDPTFDRERAAPENNYPLDDVPVRCLIHSDVGGGLVRLVEWAILRRGSRPTGRAICDLLREIAGNPFRPWKAIPEAMGGGLVQPDGATVFPSAVAREVAAGIAAGQAFDRLPVLADALEDSGVTDAELLAHCRRPGGHRRGCWAVDVVLGRA